MPDCEFKASVSLGKKAYNNALSAISTRNNAWLDTVGQNFGALLVDVANETGDLATDAANAFATNLVADTLSNVSNLAVDGGISSAGTIIATLLSGGQVTYLALAAVLMSFLRTELEQRIEISEKLMEDLELINRLLLSLINSPALRGVDAGLLNLQKAYEHITTSTTKLGEVQSQLENFSYYSLQKAEVSNLELGYAREDMKTPLADAIRTAIQGSALFTTGVVGSAATRVEAITKPDVMWDGIVNKDWSSYNELRETKRQQRRTREDQVDILMTGLAQYLSTPGGPAAVFSEIVDVIRQVQTDLGKYLPLKVSEFTAMTKGILEADNLKDLQDLAKDRNLYSLNQTIEKKVSNLSNYKESWDGMNVLSSTLLPFVRKTVEMLQELRNDIGDYLGENPAKAINTGTALSAKMTVWKRKIDAIQTNIETLQGPGEQAAALTDAYENLDNMIDAIQALNAIYNDDNDATPESALAYDLIFGFLGDLVTTLVSGGKITKIQNSVSESIVSLRNAIQADEQLLQQIYTFTGSVVAVPGIEDAIKMCTNVLDTDRYQGSLLAGLIKGIRDGDLVSLINVSMAGVEQAKDLWTNFRSAADGEGTDTSNPVLGAVLKGMGSVYSDLESCASQKLSQGGAAAEDIISDLKEAQKALKEKGEQSVQSLKESEAVQKLIELRQSIIEGTKESIEVIKEDLDEFCETVSDTIRDTLGITRDEIIDSIESEEELY